MSKSTQPSPSGVAIAIPEDRIAFEGAPLDSLQRARSLDRRGFLSSLAVAGAASAGVLAGCSSSGTIAPNGTGTVTPTTPTVVDVLNFALNLEYLESSFYLYVTTGSGLSAANMGTSPGTVTGGAKITFTNPTISSIAQQLATDEQDHVIFLRATISSLGGTPVDMPALNLGAMGAVNSDTTFLMAARQLETTGVSAYGGGAQYLVSNTTAVLYGAQILDTESQHESVLRQLCIANGVASPAVDSLDIPPTASAIFNTSPTTGLYTTRTTSQVLQIVYGAAGQTGISKGGFFPSGLNGNITAS